MFLLGHWKNFEEIENNLCLAEVEAILAAARKSKDSDRRFHAAIQGADVGEGSSDTSDFDEVVSKARAKAAGVTEEQIEWSDSGFAFEDD